MLYEQDFRHGEGLLEQNSKQQANAIEKRLSEEFTRHEKAIAKALKSSEERMSAAIAEHNQSMGWLLLKTWIWMLVSIVLFLSATSGSFGIRGIDSGAASQSPSLGGEGRQAKADPVREEIEHLCVQISDPNPNRLGKDTYWIVPKGTKRRDWSVGIALRVRTLQGAYEQQQQGIAGKLR